MNDDSELVEEIVRGSPEAAASESKGESEHNLSPGLTAQKATHQEVQPQMLSQRNEIRHEFPNSNNPPINRNTSRPSLPQDDIVADLGLTTLRPPQFARLSAPPRGFDYIPVVEEGWWVPAASVLGRLSEEKKKRWRMAGRIMETESGERWDGLDGRGNECSRCRDLGLECWGFSSKGLKQVSKPGSACARCRVDCSSCSRSTQSRVVPSSSPPPGLKEIQPKLLSSSPPGASAMVVPPLSSLFPLLLNADS